MIESKTDLLAESIRNWWIVFAIGLLLFYTDQIPASFEFIIYFFSLTLIGYRFFKNPIKIAYLARLLLFVMIGAYAYGVKLFLPDTYFSVFEFSTQRLEIARKMYALTLIGIPFCFTGLFYGERLPIKFQVTPTEYNLAFYRHLSFFFGFTITASVIVLTQTISKGNIFQGAYGGAIEGTSLPLGGINTLAGIGVVIMLYWCTITKNITYWIAFSLITAYYLISCLLLRGLRQDIASLLFCLTICYFTLKFKEFKFKWLYVAYLTPLLVVFEFFGLVRSGLSQWVSGKIPFSEVLSIGLGNANYSDVIYSGTLGPISTTLANAIDGIFYTYVPITWGKGYLEYIPRLAPEILSPNRPEDYAWFFRGIYATGGGVFEVAEAIINFGLIGALIMPFIVSVVYALVYRNFETRKTLYWTILMGAILAVFLRGAWYQTFAYVKAFEIGVFICLLHHFAFAFCKYFFLPLFKK